MSAPSHGTQPSSPCPRCRRSNCWYEPGCKHCGLNFWTGDDEPLESYFARRFGGKR